MTKKRALLIVAVLLVFCCVGLTFVVVLSPETATPEPETIPTLKTEPLPTKTPTDTPVATSTKVPTNTPVPEQPTATSTPPGPSLEVQSYLNAVAGHMQNLSGALQAISDLSSSPNPFSDDWKIKMATQLAMIRITHEALTKMDVPDEMQAIHSAILDATADCDLATYHLAEGIDSLDADEIQAATDLLRSCGEKTKIPFQMISEY